MMRSVNQMNKLNKTRSKKICPGEAVLAMVYQEEFTKHNSWNEIYFVSAGLVIIMLIIEVNHRCISKVTPLKLKSMIKLNSTY